MITLKYPPFVHWEVTPECNHNCIHCYNYWRKDEEKLKSLCIDLPESHYMQIAKKIVQQKAMTAVITGGEPLLVFEKIKKAILFLRKNNINISINTNAVLLNKEIIEFLKDNNIGLFISFPCHDSNICDFITDKKNSLNRILNSLDELSKTDIHFSLNIVASKINIDYIEETVRFLKNIYDIKRIYITRVGKPVNSDDTFNQYLLDKDDICKLQDISVKVKYEYGIDVDTGCPYTLCSINFEKAFEMFAYKKICTAGKTSYALDTFGNLKACPRDSKIYGNILEEDFEKIWGKTKEWRDGSLIPSECNKCNMREICKGGCRVDALPFTGKMNSLDTSARIDLLPVKYCKKKEFFNYSQNDAYIVNTLKVVEEDFGYRVSHNKSYVFITKELFDFLNSNTKFTITDIEKGFSVDYNTASDILTRLLKNGIVQVERR